MQLGSWLNKRKMAYGEFGALIGTSAEAVRRYAIGLRTPRRMIMQKIVEATNGSVRPGDFYQVAIGEADKAA